MACHVKKSLQKMAHLLYSFIVAFVAYVLLENNITHFSFKILPAEMYCIVEKFGGIKFGEFTHFEHLAKKSLANE